MLGLFPHDLDWVQLRAVGRKEEKLQALLGPLGLFGPNIPGMVDPGVVQDDHRLFRDRIGHPVEEGDDGRRIDPLPRPAPDQVLHPHQKTQNAEPPVVAPGKNRPRMSSGVPLRPKHRIHGESRFVEIRQVDLSRPGLPCQVFDRVPGFFEADGVPFFLRLYRTRVQAYPILFSQFRRVLG